MRHLVPIALGLALGLAGSPRAQTQAVTLSAAQSRLTSHGHVAHGLRAAYDRDVTAWLSFGASAHVVRTEGRDPLDLILVDTHRWRDRTQAVLDLHATGVPVALVGAGLRHRLGVVAGVALRWKDETHLHGGLVGTLPDGASPGQQRALADLIEGWASRGPDYEVITFHYGGGGADRRPGTDPALLSPGTAAAYVLHAGGVDAGLSLGLDYSVGVGQTVLRAQAVYRRYRDQRLIVGSHALDLSVGAGVRF